MKLQDVLNRIAREKLFLVTVFTSTGTTFSGLATARILRR